MTIFVDTNVLLYSISDRREDQVKRGLAIDLLKSRRCALSAQVFNEFFTQATKRTRPDRLPDETAKALIDRWRRFPVQPLDMPLTDLAWEIKGRTNYSWWDCMIIAAAVASGCDTLATEDMQHGHVVDGVRIVNPFRDAG
ncbi:PIN domain-containing protein [Sphingomonas gilva]|uniref:Ribonuclease VapC n=1 Tax=Sphingomonas gilva TaxID=2305907 RepID=A0A396RUB2_9SPHN|nr:PIN domain-containing protein [Sphingomonas gilva]RHW17983.1 PIN domain-containing protein [Sphingomonas gilva]